MLKSHSRRVGSCASDPAGRVVVSVGWDCNIQMWDAQTGKSQGTLKKDQYVTSPVSEVLMRSNALFSAVCHVVFDRCPLNCVSFHPEGKLIVTGCWDSTLKLYNIDTKERKAVRGGFFCSNANTRNGREQLHVKMLQFFRFFEGI